MNVLLLSMSAHITKQLGMAPGGEFRAAYREVLHCTSLIILHNSFYLQYIYNYSLVKNCSYKLANLF